MKEQNKSTKILEKYNNLKNEKFKNAKILQPTNNQGVIMNVGNILSALHKVPNITHNRLFISIMPCSTIEIKKSNNDIKKFNKEFLNIK